MSRQTFGDRAGEQSGRLDLAQARPDGFDRIGAGARRFGNAGNIQPAVARLVESLGELQGDPALIDAGKKQVDLFEDIDRERTRTAGDEVERIGKALALANSAGRRIAAPVGVLARPAVVGLGQRRCGGGQGFGGVGWHVEDRRVRFRDRPVVRATLGQQRILLEFLLNEGSEFEVRELQQLDGLLKLRRHRQRLTGRQEETWTDTHRYP